MAASKTKKIVINVRYGGFSFSDEFVESCKKRGIEHVAETHRTWD